MVILVGIGHLNIILLGKKCIEWFAVFVTLSGAIATTLSYEPYNVYLLNFGSVLWTIWAIFDRKPSIIIVNLGMLLVYSYGTILRIFL